MQSPRDGGDPADLTVVLAGLIRADDAHGAFGIMMIDICDRGAKEDLVAIF